MQRKQFFTPAYYLIIFPSKVALIKLISLFFSVRERLQDIQREKKNRKWSIVEALKDVMNSITSRFRGSSKSGVSLDKLVDLLEDHEVKINLEITAQSSEEAEGFVFFNEWMNEWDSDWLNK